MHRQGAAGAEIVLDIDNQERFKHAAADQHHPIVGGKRPSPNPHAFRREPGAQSRRDCLWREWRRQVDNPP